MKKIGMGLLAIATIAWLVITNIRYSGLNSMQNLAGYHNGILGLKGLSRPRTSTLTNTGTDAGVYMDSLGIPHIFGRSMNDVAYAAGYVHARDRYFQMELMAHTVAGELAEILGDPGVGSDKFWKRFDLERKAREYFDSLAIRQPALYSYLKAYEAGVNEYVSREDPSARDPMYAIWHYSPKPWKAYYTFLIQWHMSSELAFYDDYPDRQEILDKLPDTVRRILYPVYPSHEPEIIPANHSLKNTLEEGRGLVRLYKPFQPNRYPTREFDRSLGSNNWAIAPAHTQSGELFLCNDLHLPLVAPNLLYEIHFSCPDMQVYGYSIPGVPMVLTGHNARIAWGITNGGWDVTEQYLLKTDPAKPGNYWLDGKWQTMTQKDLIIRVKGAKDEKLTTYYSVFGPVVHTDKFTYGLKWHPLASCNAIEAFWKLMRSSDWADFRNALRQYDHPAQNFIYGDIQGNIGMVCAGKMPVKPSHYTGGLLDGTRSPKWEYLDFDSLPQAYNPSKGYLFSANQQPEQGENYYSSRWFDDLYRPRRIDEILSRKAKFDWESVHTMQSDIMDLSVNDLKTLMGKYPPENGFGRNWELMKKWDGILTPGNGQAIFYKVFRRAVRIAGIEMARTIGVKSPPTYDQFMNFLLQDTSLVYGKIRLDSKDCFKRVVRIADSVYAGLDLSKKFNPYAFGIPQMTFLPGLTVDIEDIGGSDNTINVNYGAHPVIRTLIEIKDSAILSWMVNATGQTGRINESGYFQQLPSWKRNQLHKTQFISNPSGLHAITDTLHFTK